MQTLLTPKQVARAIDVSESSVKRWCDKGVIPTQYTAGGHRRIQVSELLEWLQDCDRTLVHPEALGLPSISGQSDRTLQRARERLVDALLAGDEPATRQIAVDLVLARHPLSAVFDQVFASAFKEIGDRWVRGEAEIYQERRGCEIALRVIGELRSLLAPAPAGAPVAIGATPAGDPFHLATTMAELVLTQSGWNASSLGCNLPFGTLAMAVRRYRPRLVWLSCSHIPDTGEFLSEFSRFADGVDTRTLIVAGGTALTPELRNQMSCSAYCEDMRQFQSYCESVEVM